MLSRDSPCISFRDSHNSMLYLTHESVRQRLRSMSKVAQGIRENWDFNPRLALYTLASASFPCDKNEIFSLKNLGQTLLFMLFS